ncbi:2-acyl-glycerophospho-ethanolamine acyltransferase [Aureimonas ureilytica]|uniref:2-acyl-glycerophospho-ethanolamine acyltransferase n=1 Tax=Aureimonas ureilytica TaxID=401562 RepID=A0A175R866_9HYPH|nr:acyl-[ACP]--phospholipid O-acyltransferase [Aureimonas ureilytica]KTQ92672.1 2-acyl-glycerophospho-ethanolamine acyltransferase [Aureimonas ureilytica]
MASSLLRSRRFAPLFWTQFLTAFGDNLLRNTLVFLILFRAASQDAGAMIALAGVIFMLPFLLLAALGGQMADRFDKALVAQRLKLAEIGVAALGAVALLLGSLPMMMLALAGFGTVSALFGPIKYSVLPEQLATEDLPRANAWVEGGTFTAILAGTITAGLLSTVHTGWAAALLCIVAVTSWLTARAMPKGIIADPTAAMDVNILRSTGRFIAALRGDRRILMAALTISWFWMLGLILMSLLPAIIKNGLGGTQSAVTLALAIYSVAIAAGSALAAWLCQGRTTLLPAVLGTALVALFGADLAWTVGSQSGTPVVSGVSAFLGAPGSLRALVDLAGMAVAAALISVPAFSAIQAWAPVTRRARTIAGANALSAAFMVGGSLVLAFVQYAGASLAAILAGLSLLNLLAAGLLLRHLPTPPLRDALSILFRVVFRLEVRGLEKLEAAGPAPILAFNHVSFLDAALALSLTDRDPVFAIDHTIAQRAWVRPFLKLVHALPLDPSRPISTRTLIKAVDAGSPLVIFPEGRITTTGALMKIYDGAALVAGKTGAPMVPIRIEGLEQSYASRLTGGEVRRRLFPKVRVTILDPVRIAMPEGGTARQRRSAAGARLTDTMSDLVFRTERTDVSVVERLIHAAERTGLSRLAVEDPMSGRMSFGRLLTGVRVLASCFDARFAPGEAVGVMLPNAAGTVATCLGLMSAGRVPAMINFTAGAANIRSAATASGARTILSSRAFIEKAKLQPLVEALQGDLTFVWLEDIRASVTPRQKLVGLLRRKHPLVPRKADDPAAILFTSGSEGAPKGVVLSHRNILSNIAQVAARIDFNGRDKVFNVLPMFHSFGLTAGTLLPLVSGVPIYLYPSPLHYRIVPELIYGSNATILFGTDTFLTGYARTAHPYDFRSLRYVFAGAEPIRAATRQTYAERFGVRLFEGYGVTETAPVLALNTAMHNRPGTVGRLLPGIEHRLEPVPGIETGGRLIVRGPNVMLGYLKADRPGALQPPEGGWHDTGDIVSIDADGFVRIEGRAKRFAKIGGEMVSLAAVEALAAELWPGAPSVAVSVPDERKGERIVLLTQEHGARRADFQSFARAKKVSDLTVPAEVRVLEKLPLLGTGKIDVQAANALVREDRARREPELSA